MERPAGERAKDLALYLFIFAVVIASCWAVIELTIGRSEAEKMFAEAFHRPMTLEDETVSIPSDELRGVRMAVPYSGHVTLEVEAMGGQRVGVHVINGADLLQLANAKPPLTALKLNDHGAFEATAGPKASRVGRLSAGDYIVVLEHEKHGVPASDARVVARLAP